MVNLLRVDASVPTAKNYEMDMFRDDGRPLAYVTKTQPAYSKLGIYILKEFWLKEKVLPSIIFASSFLMTWTKLCRELFPCK